MTSPAHQVADRVVMPGHLGLYYGGRWHEPIQGKYAETHDPSTGAAIASVAEASDEDAIAAIAAARSGFELWRQVHPLERARILRRIAAMLREHAAEIALLDAYNGGNPVRDLMADANIAADLFELHAGLVTEMKGNSIPMGPGALNFSIREPIGVVARITAFNHPFMFAAGRAAAPLAAGNAVIIKPPQQAPLSTLRLAEMIGDMFPPGTFNVLTGADVGAVLSSHPGIDMVTLIGSVPTGRKVYQSAASTIKPVILELGGKNALIACADADPDEVAEAAVQGMNYAWCGQSCGSLSRLFLHDAIHEAVLTRLKTKIAHYKPGPPGDPSTTMGAIVNKRQYDSILGHIDSARAEGAQLICGGGRPTDPALSHGWYIEPTVFTGVTQRMRIAQEEVFGPVQAVLRWNDEAAMLRDVNSVELGLTCAVFSNDLNTAHRIAAAVDVGFLWINTVSAHYVGAPFGGVKQSGIGRDECLGELLSFTREKNIHIKLRPQPRLQSA
nr:MULTISPECIES: aldehyde dehydrogenase family protein [unclassified Bradyrhizobium]